MLKGFQSNPCGTGLKLQILQTVGSLQLVSSNGEVERMKCVKCLACQWEEGGFGVIPRREDEGWSLTCSMRRRRWRKLCRSGEEGLFCCAEEDNNVQE